MFQFDLDNCLWLHEPKEKQVGDNLVTITTEANTDLWQRTYYRFQHDNAPILYMTTEEQYFTFTVKTEFRGKVRFDQCGIVLYQNSENWLKASIEYENNITQRLGSVVTNNGYSDWATTDISANIQLMYYRLSRRNSDYCIESSLDGITYRQIRICHLFAGSGNVNFGIYACSPEASSFTAEFSEMSISQCVWEPHL